MSHFQPFVSICAFSSAFVLSKMPLSTLMNANAFCQTAAAFITLMVEHLGYDIQFDCVKLTEYSALSGNDFGLVWKPTQKSILEFGIVNENYSKEISLVNHQIFAFYQKTNVIFPKIKKSKVW